jgi:hypothetical protein
VATRRGGSKTTTGRQRYGHMYGDSGVDRMIGGSSSSSAADAKDITGARRGLDGGR